MNSMYKWLVSDTQRTVINVLDLKPFYVLRMIYLMEEIDHVLRYANNAKLAW
jgi:hypothetical protein